MSLSSSLLLRSSADSPHKLEVRRLASQSARHREGSAQPKSFLWLRSTCSHRAVEAQLSFVTYAKWLAHPVRLRQDRWAEHIPLADPIWISIFRSSSRERLLVSGLQFVTPLLYEPFTTTVLPRMRYRCEVVKSLTMDESLVQMLSGEVLPVAQESVREEDLISLPRSPHISIRHK